MDESPLKRLPIELRLDIYERVLYTEEVVRVTLNKPINKKKRASMNTYNSQPHRLAIRSTCKEIAEETVGRVFKINDSWSFVHMDDNSTAWGKRLRQWCRAAGEDCLQRARKVQFDIGEWDSRPKSYPRGDLTKVLHAQIGSMYQNLPKRLRQCDQTFKLRLKWSSGVKLADGSRDRLDVVTLVLPLWSEIMSIQWCLFEAATQARQALSKYDDTWYEGSVDGVVPAFVDPPEYDKKLARKIRPERSTLLELASEIEMATTIAFKKSARGQLEEHAVGSKAKGGF
jgi:hypothetical protein